MSVTRILCDDCGFAQCYCTCKPPEATKEGERDKRKKFYRHQTDDNRIWFIFSTDKQQSEGMQAFLAYNKKDADDLCAALNRPNDTVAVSRECAERSRARAFEDKYAGYDKGITVPAGKDCAELTAALEAK